MQRPTRPSSSSEDSDNGYPEFRPRFDSDSEEDQTNENKEEKEAEVEVII